MERFGMSSMEFGTHETQSDSCDYVLEPVEDLSKVSMVPT